MASTRKTRLLLQQELLYYAFALVVGILVVSPMWKLLLPYFKWANVFLVFLCLAIFKWLFFLKSSVLLRPLIVKFVLGIAIIFLVLWCFTFLQETSDRFNEGFISDFSSKDWNEQELGVGTSKYNYFKKEITFFNLSAMILLVLLEFRLIVDIFKNAHRLNKRWN